MSIQKYSGEVNLDNPVIDERPDGTVRMYFHDLPPLLLKYPIRYPPPPPDGEDKTTD